jgi:hypothetical protein
MPKMAPSGEGVQLLERGGVFATLYHSHRVRVIDDTIVSTF